jgi:hypothetical protein
MQDSKGINLALQTCKHHLYIFDRLEACRLALQHRVTAKQASASYGGRFQRMDMYLSVLMIRLSAYVFVHALSLKHKVQIALQKASCREFSAYFHVYGFVLLIPKGSMHRYLFHNSPYLGTTRLGKVWVILTANHPYPFNARGSGVQAMEEYQIGCDIKQTGSTIELQLA